MSAHTPGPWHFDGLAGVPLPLAKNDHGEPLLMVRGRGASVAEVIPQQNAEANARLIAAAPDLLAALERVVSESSKPTDPDAERWDHDITKPDHWVQEVLAKARGQ